MSTKSTTQTTTKKPRRKKLARFTNIPELWAEHVAQSGYRTHMPQFLDKLRSLTTEPDLVDECVKFCLDCHVPNLSDRMHVPGHGHHVCDTCIKQYTMTCAGCSELWRFLTFTLDDTELCQSCLGSGWCWCGDCDGYYPLANRNDHLHDDSCQCESPAPSFTIRNDGEPPLANDVRTTITLPAGVISDEGMDQIGQYVRDWGRKEYHDQDNTETYWKVHSVSLMAGLDPVWQTKDGNFTKRLSRLAYKSQGLKLPPEVISQVGCIARDHSTAIDFQIEVTRNLNLPAYLFAHEDSCWWSSYAESRCVLKNNGGFGLRTFGEEEDDVRGRAWIIPLRKGRLQGQLVPTFETQKPDAFVVFNGYGDLSGYTAARILSHMAGMTYRKVALEAPPMYVNSDSGYLVAPEAIATKYTDGRLNLDMSAHSDLFHSESNENQGVLSHV